jgi:hypothetical protein
MEIIVTVSWNFVLLWWSFEKVDLFLTDFWEVGRVSALKMKIDVIWHVMLCGLAGSSIVSLTTVILS